MPTDKTLRSFLRVEQKLSDSERKIKNPFIFCVPVKATGDKSAKTSALALLDALADQLPPTASACFVSVSSNAELSSEKLDMK